MDTIIAFSKWEGTGNDLIVVDDRGGTLLQLLEPIVTRLCDRRRGIGSDGLVLLRSPVAEGTSFHMDFMNPDGSRSFCGNGSRCAYAAWSELVDNVGPMRFTAHDGVHEARFDSGMVTVSMQDVAGSETLAEQVVLLDTGSPHVVKWVEDPEKVDLIRDAHEWRYAQRFQKKGVNVNLVSVNVSGLVMRTYERGVEGETLSCGTGVTAAALGAMEHHGLASPVHVRTRGGELQVSAQKTEAGFQSIELSGAVRHVFDGTIDITHVAWT